MKKVINLLSIFIISFSMISCSTGSSSDNDTPLPIITPVNPTQELPDTKKPIEEKHQYISIRLGRACKTEDEIKSYGPDDHLWIDKQEDKVGSITTGYYYGLQLVTLNSSSYRSPSIKIDGNQSPDTYISKEKIDTSLNGSFYSVHIADNETAKSIKIIADNGLGAKGSLTLDICEKFNRSDLSNNLSFSKKTYLSREDVYFIRDTISENIDKDYNLDFSNCVFELNKIPEKAFCKFSSGNTTSESLYNNLDENGALKNIKRVILPDSITFIGTGAFNGCYNMTLDKLPDDLSELGVCSFAYCKSLAINKIPEGITSLVTSQFVGCDSITEIKLPDSLIDFDVGVFQFCKNLSSLYIPKNVIGISNYSISPINFILEVDKDNEKYKTENGFLYSKDGKILYLVPSSKIGDSYSIPSTITKIATYALCELENLTTLYIPSSVVEMEEYAIANCRKLRTINIDFSKKPNGWDKDWLWDFEEKRINFNGASSGKIENTENTGDSNNLLEGTFTIKNNSSGKLKFTKGTLEFIYNGLTRNTYSYELSSSVLTVTLSKSNVVGKFDIKKTDNGYKLQQKDDIALSWIGTWTHAASMEEIEIYK